MDAGTGSTMGGWVLGALAAGAAAFERIKSARSGERERAAREEVSTANQQHAVNRQILEGKDELVRIAREAADAWKSKYDAEHTEYSDYRKHAHDLAQASQAKMLHLAEDNAALRSKTDLTPILNFQKDAIAFHAEQTKIIQTIVLMLGEIQKKLAGATP